MTPTGLVFERQNSTTAAAERPEVEDLYRRAYTERIATGDPFSDPTAFMHRFDAYVRNPALELVTAVLRGIRIGQTWGWPLTADSRWWNGLTGEPEPGFTDENGRRTFALSEIMIDHHYVGHGIAHALHDHLLEERPEERATLLVNPANTRARDTYLRWGWTPVAQLRPGWPGAHLLNVLIKPLHSQKTE